jgi:protein-S-isoprenylcysteine O-methyltransferase Ste14
VNIREGLRAALMTLVVYLCLPLLGWWLAGTDPWPLQVGEFLGTYLAQPVRVVYLISVCGLSIVSGWLNASFPINSKAFLPRPGLLHWRNIAMETILVLGPYCDRRGLMVINDFAVLGWAGVILFILGMTLSVWANELLSRAAISRQAAPYESILIVVGPYKWLRYPVYLGQLLYSLGAALLFRSRIGLGSFLLMMNFILLRIHEEEQHARKKHGIQWSAYSRHSWKLIPFIY